MIKGLSVILVTVVAVACGSGTSGDDDSTGSAVTRIELRAHDFGYGLSDDRIPAGPVETVLVNHGDQPHQALIYRLNDGVDFKVFKKKVMADDSLLPQLARGGTDGLSAVAGPGEEISSTGDHLDPGNYAVICFIGDQSLKTSKNHAELGMIASLTVE